MTQPAIKDAKPPVKRRISPAMRKAITLKVMQGLTWKAAAAKAEVSEAGIHKARKLSHVQEFEEQTKLQLIQDVENNKAPYKARAFEVANDIMENGKTEAARLRAVEFIAGERKGSHVNIAVQVNNAPSQGYEYPRPNQKVYEIVDASDTASLGQGDETPVKQGD